MVLCYSSRATARLQIPQKPLHHSPHLVFEHMYSPHAAMYGIKLFKYEVSKPVDLLDLSPLAIKSYAMM